ncbi:hypothetical protein BDQ12DRAFT_666712 [Crucibulum laeve]|uniref:Uncharacterized protein n=1 Tax=Crucibulum laeve TaxID=68775 RepID=A0A5C3LY83_9AGAR|nr:hypothetical protein BDQ12DRAFT_666712 [Crucibulum laeve]
MAWSLAKLLEMMEAACKQMYSPCNYNDMELKLATAIYIISGNAALHALHNSVFAFPSCNTITHQIQEFQLHITVDKPQMINILDNIKTMFSYAPPGMKKVGITLSMDEITSDGRLCYLTESDEIAGLCEHTKYHIPSLRMGKNITIAHAICTAVKEEKIHIGQEIFFLESLDINGLNLYTGPNNEVQDLNYKHIFKSILVDCVVINKSLLALWFERLTHVDWSENPIFALLNLDADTLSEHIHALLSPKDAQDVPRAIKLLSLTADICNLDSSDFDPSELTTHHALCVFGVDLGTGL